MSSVDHGTASPGRVDDLLDRGLLALAGGRRRPILELVRDHPGALRAMAARMGVSTQEVSLDLAAFHDLEFEAQLEAEAARYDGPLLAAARLAPDARVLDVGCGSGLSARAAGRAAHEGSVLGVDVSAALVKRAAERVRAEGPPNVTFVRGDAATHPFPPGSFDVVLSRFGAMYFGHPVPAFAHLAEALRPGGRLVAVAWRDLAANEWLAAVAGALAAGRPLPERAPGQPGPFGLARADDVWRILGEAGFADVTLDEVKEPVSFGPDVEAAYAMVSTQKLARDLLEGTDAATRGRALGALRSLLEAHATPAGVLFGASAWLITATA